MKRSRGHAGCCEHVEQQDIDKERWNELLHKLLNKGQHNGNCSTATLYCTSCCAASAIGGNPPGCGHGLAIDVQRLELYCMHCRDYVYLDEFDQVVMLMSQQLMQKQHQQRVNASNRLPDTDPGTDIQAKRQRMLTAGDNTDAAEPKSDLDLAAQQCQYQSSTSSLTAAAAGVLSSYCGAWQHMQAADGFPLGLRGLNNLGNTCFMNSVLQVLFHAPLLPAFYLGEGHDPTTCRRTARDKPCLSCQMEAVFCEVYSGNRQPFSPAEFLYQWWRFAEDLAGYQQQDAHEFYLSLLEGLSGSVVPLPAADTAAHTARQVGPEQAAYVGAEEQQGQQQLTQGMCPQQMQLEKQQQQLGGQEWQNGQADNMQQQQHLYNAVAADGLQPFKLDVLGNIVGYHDAYSWQQYGGQQQLQQRCAAASVTGYDTPASSRGTPEPNSEGEADQPSGPTAGLVELLFAGLLRSDVCCCACGHTSTAHDPFRDISLDLHVPRPPRLPPKEPHSRPADTAAAGAGAGATAQAATNPVMAAAGAAATTAILAAARHTAEAGVSAVGQQGVREPTPPLLLLTPSPTPPPSDLLVEYWDNTTTAGAAAAAGTYSQATSAASGLTKPGSAVPDDDVTATTAVSTEVSPDVTDEEVQQARSSVAPTQPAAAQTPAGQEAATTAAEAQLALRCQLLSNTAALAAASTWTQSEQGNSVRDTTPEVSDIGGPAASQSSQQVGGVSGAADAAAGGVRDTSPDVCVITAVTDGPGGEGAGHRSHATARQHTTLAAAAAGREATPQSQQKPPALQQQQQSQCGTKDSRAAPAVSAGGASGVASSLVQVLRAPVAAIKQLLPGWTSNSSGNDQRPQQLQGLPPLAGMSLASQPVEGNGDSMAGAAADAAGTAVPSVGGAAADHLQQQQHLMQDHASWQQQEQQHYQLPPDLQYAQQQQWQQPSPEAPQEAAAGGSGWQGGCDQAVEGTTAAGRGDAMASAAAAAAAAAAKLPRQQRCGQCKYCLNKHLKKGCEATKKFREEMKAAAALVKQQEQTATAAAAASSPGDAAAAAPAVPFGSTASAATQPTHPLAGVASQQQEQQSLASQQHQQQQQQHVQGVEEQHWLGVDQQYQQHYGAHDLGMYYQQQQHHAQYVGDAYQQQQQLDHAGYDYFDQQGFGIHPDHAAAFYSHQLQQHQHEAWDQQHLKQQPLTAGKHQKQQATKQKKQQQRGSPKPPAGSMAQDCYTAAALSQAIMQRRDEKGRFYKKEDLAAWARQLHEEGHLTNVVGVPDATAEQVAAARARGRPLPPAYRAALAAKEAAAAAAAGLVLPAKPGAGAGSGTAKAAGSKTAAGKKGVNGAAGAAAAKKQAAPPAILRLNELSLAGCLRRFVRPEALGSGSHWHCTACGSTQAALKQMSIRRLPLVLCFHVKRFEHGGGSQRPKKLDVPLRFPLHGLDMAPFTTTEVMRARAGGSRCNAADAADATAGQMNAGSSAAAAAASNSKQPQAAADTDTASAQPGDVSFQQQCLYELFGVVSHSGDMASGHYVSYVKCEGHWYLVNDPWVVAVTEADVAQVQAYMLFYAQAYLFASGSSNSSSNVGPGQDKAAAAAGKSGGQQTANAAPLQAPAAALLAAGPAVAPAGLHGVSVTAEPTAVIQELSAEPVVAVKLEQVTPQPPVTQELPASDGASYSSQLQQQAQQQQVPGPTFKSEPGVMQLSSAVQAPLMQPGALAVSAAEPLSLPPIGSPRLDGDMLMLSDLPQHMPQHTHTQFLNDAEDVDMIRCFLEDQASVAGLDDMPFA